MEEAIENALVITSLMNDLFTKATGTQSPDLASAAIKLGGVISMAALGARPIDQSFADELAPAWQEVATLAQGEQASLDAAAALRAGIVARWPVAIPEGA